MKFYSLLPVVAIATSCFCVSAACAQQNVFVDFDTATAFDDHVYTPAERTEILDRMAEDYAPFDFSFTDLRPAGGDFATLTINDGQPFGLAEFIDPRNLVRNDTATIDVNLGATTSEEFITLTANVASHELGHLLGLRHFDSFGPIGSGLDPNSAAAISFNPDYLGPQGAGTETRNHIMESDMLTEPEVQVNQFFSERSAIKLTFIEDGTVIAESDATKNTLATAQEFELEPIIVPNTIEVGERAGQGDFDVDAITITGSLGADGFDDFFRFNGEAGDLLNVELFSETLRNNPNIIDTTIRLLDADGNQVNYFGLDAFNDDELEGFDSILIDLVLPSDGDYFFQVGSFNGNSSGDYELFVTRFNGSIVAVPEPSSLATLLLLGVAGLSRRRRRS